MAFKDLPKHCQDLKRYILSMSAVAHLPIPFTTACEWTVGALDAERCTS